MTTRKKAYLWILPVVVFLSVSIAAQDKSTWTENFALFREKMEKGEDLSTGSSNNNIEPRKVKWESKFKQAMKGEKGGYFIEFDEAPLSTPKYKVRLSFSCSEADFAKWQSVPKGAKVIFTAEWLPFTVQMPDMPATYFNNTRLVSIVTDDKK